MTYIPNPEFDKLLERSSSAQESILAAAEAAASAARAIAPRRSGDYAEGIEPGVDAEGDVVLNANDWKSHFIEFGTADTPTFAPLRRGVLAAGLRFAAGK